MSPAPHPPSRLFTEATAGTPPSPSSPPRPLPTPSSTSLPPGSPAGFLLASASETTKGRQGGLKGAERTFFNCYHCLSSLSTEQLGWGSRYQLDRMEGALWELLVAPWGCGGGDISPYSSCALLAGPIIKMDITQFNRRKKKKKKQVQFIHGGLIDTVKALLYVLERW